MNTIKLNELELRVESYSKNTYFSNNTITSSAACNVITDDIDSLNELAEEDITSIQIYHDEELIYNLSNITAHIDSINEYLNQDRMNININLTFQMNI